MPTSSHSVMGPTGMPNFFIAESMVSMSTPSWTSAVTSVMNGARDLRGLG